MYPQIEYVLDYFDLSFLSKISLHRVNHKHDYLIPGYLII